MGSNILTTGRKVQYRYYIKGMSFEGIADAAATVGVNKSTIMRWCNSDKKPDCYREPVDAEHISRDDVDSMAADENITPLDFMLKVMRDPSRDIKLRAQMANWAAPYMHKRATADQGKKPGRKKLAEDAGKGRFSPSAPPKLVAAGGKAVK